MGIDAPKEEGAEAVEPISTYYDFLPKKADVRSLAYHFTGEYRSGAHARLDLIRELWSEAEQWREAWRGRNGQPFEDLCIFRDGNSYVLVWHL